MSRGTRPSPLTSPRPPLFPPLPPPPPLPPQHPQQYLTMLGSTVLIPTLVIPPMGGTPSDLARVICTIFFVSGLATLLQTTVGDRLPVVQGGSFAYIAPALAVAAGVKARGGFGPDAPDGSNHARFLATVREVSGGVIASSAVIVALAASGALRLVLPLVSPLTVAVNIAVIGLALYGAGVPAAAACFPIAAPAFLAVILFSQYLRNVTVPLGPRLGRWEEGVGGGLVGGWAGGSHQSAACPTPLSVRRGTTPTTGLPHPPFCPGSSCLKPSPSFWPWPRPGAWPPC